jgi:hypothetical protein
LYTYTYTFTKYKGYAYVKGKWTFPGWYPVKVNWCVTVPWGWDIIPDGCKKKSCCCSWCAWGWCSPSICVCTKWNWTDKYCWTGKNVCLLPQLKFSGTANVKFVYDSVASISFTTDHPVTSPILTQSVTIKPFTINLAVKEGKNSSNYIDQTYNYALNVDETDVQTTEQKDGTVTFTVSQPIGSWSAKYTQHVTGNVKIKYETTLNASFCTCYSTEECVGEGQLYLLIAITITMTVLEYGYYSQSASITGNLYLPIPTDE